MAVSDQTATKLYELICRYVPVRKRKAIIEEMMNIPGNKSYRDTVTRLLDIHEHAIMRLEDVDLRR